ncbi:nitrate reductase subunit alpha [Desulfosarcina widdelii]|uniref:nitrate reductase (quinone) n=1 Tax=Desulfosarcina widdelii TaxID=947919 RepID=A0A5K7Z9P9_9BACT|nr:nitrate reductase subunit alpha [Desulfosarcina widdelii]BBO73207.1 nitrate reductase subunit alpha [Desulfosarcina widdelii]
MSERRFLSTLRFFRPKGEITGCREKKTRDSWAETRCGQREWEDLYRRRWQYDKKVRSTHGVNCTGSCSWDVYVKDGILVWETQATDYPACGDGYPNHEPRGCPRGATYSWYTYSPVRLKYPLVRSSLMGMWREAMEQFGDPVAAWESIVNDDDKRRRYQQERGKGGFIRVSWDQVATMISAGLIHTIKKYGPDRIFGFSPIPAMSMVCYASGSRFLSLIGASMISFYDWYCDLPPASPQIWGEQTDVPESADWFESSYFIVWGTNLPMTRTPDAHFYSEARYRGARVAAVAPDYAEYVKFADTWLPAKAGTDAALAMAMSHVIVKEFYIDRQVPYFMEYAKHYTDLPFVVVLKDMGENSAPGRFLRAADLDPEANNARWKTVVVDGNDGSLRVPNGSIGFRWNEDGRWNLNMKDDSRPIDPLLTFAEQSEGWQEVSFPVFDATGTGVRKGIVPFKMVAAKTGHLKVATVFDLMCAQLGVPSKHAPSTPADYPTDYTDAKPYTPAWQETITGVPADDAIRVAREFADNAEKTRGKSMIFLGAGTNHWYHSDMIYRTIINLVTLCGCQGVNGGGWAHYVGQEKVRPQAAWSQVAFGLDWRRPPRLQNGTSFYYFASDQWRYDGQRPESVLSPLSERAALPHMADYNAIAARLGWLPSYPQFDRNPIDLIHEAVAEGAATDEQIIAYAVDKLKTGDLRFAVEDPDNPANFPRVLFLWRANLLGASGKGHEYFLKHLLGTESAVLNTDSDLRPQEIQWRDPAPEGKLDLLVTLELRMSTSAMYADIALPAAGWYEMHDLNTTDMHPFIHPFNPAIDPPWETRTNWEQFKTIAEKFSQMAADHLGEVKDLVATPLMHDSPGEIAQPDVRDWRKGECEPQPGKTMPSLTVVTRDYPNIYRMMTALGPLAASAGVGSKGILWKAEEEIEALKASLGCVTDEGVSRGQPTMQTAKQASETILMLAPETNGETAVKAWTGLEKRTGLSLKHLSLRRQGERFRFDDLTAQPRKIITSPIWSGIESEERRYSPFVINIEEKVPFRTLTGRAQFYQDHPWMLDFGEHLPVYRPPMDMTSMEPSSVAREPERELVLNYLTPHSKWSIHSTYSDTLTMLTLFRGGEAIWINDEDARKIAIKDNEWLECFNANGVVMAKAVVSPRIPTGKAFMYHAQERLINTPGSKLSGKRGGTHNSVTRIVVKPTHMIGGYAQLSYGFNYYGPIGSQRDETIIVRKAGEVNWYED